MTSSDIAGDKELENNKHVFYNRMLEDGKLVSPIDLRLETTQQLKLEVLKWNQIDVPPVRMKLTNTGETVIVSAKWATERPYLTGGPLRDSYVFSQIHFHWGSDDGEGSEHTVRGICYPMEMHVVFYKTRYLTQEAALKQEDGVIIVVYLIKLAHKTTAGVRWLVSQLDRVRQPHTSTPLPLSPLSSLVVPFIRDYLIYWGSLQTSRCAHTMLWFVSRAALAITVDDLNAFRTLLNARKEPMNKNFRGSNDAMGRVVYHVNPSKDMENLLLPGSVDPPGQAIVVNHFKLPPLNKEQAEKIYSKGDSMDHSIKLTSTGGQPEEKKAVPSLFGNSRGEFCGFRRPGSSPCSDKGGSIKTDCSSSGKKTELIKSTEVKTPEIKSRLPVPTGTKVLQSSLAQYFRPDSAHGENTKRQPKTAPRTVQDMKRAPAVTTIPRPIGRNAGKLEENSEVKAEPACPQRPASYQRTRQKNISVIKNK